MIADRGGVHPQGALDEHFRDSAEERIDGGAFEDVPGVQSERDACTLSLDVQNRRDACSAADGRGFTCATETALRVIPVERHSICEEVRVQIRQV